MVMIASASSARGVRAHPKCWVWFEYDSRIATACRCHSSHGLLAAVVAVMWSYVYAHIHGSKLTCPELTELLKIVGLPARGNKPDLVSALYAHPLTGQYGQEYRAPRFSMRR